jgi:hypothetical protein
MGKSNKGSAWERQISRFLTKWLTGQDKELFFYRSPGSGAVATVNLGNKAISGDIIALKPDATILIDVFSIECKNGYKEASLDKHLKTNKSDPLKTFWIQCVSDAQKAEKSPMLIYKKLGLKSPWVGIDDNFFNHVMPYIPELRYVKLSWGNCLTDTYFFELHDFFSIITPDIVKGFINKGTGQ